MASSRPVGRPPKPLEEKRRLGNPGGRKLPDPENVVVLPAADEIPEPSRPLGRHGRELWERVWTAGAAWIADRVDCEQVLITCEQMDERAQLRMKVIQEGNWRERAALRALDAQIMDGLALLGFNPVDRSRLGVAEVKRVSALDKLIQDRRKGAYGA